MASEAAQITSLISNHIFRTSDEYIVTNYEKDNDKELTVMTVQNIRTSNEFVIQVLEVPNFRGTGLDSNAKER